MKKYLIFIFFFSVISLYLNWRVFKSLQEQVFLYVDFNFNQGNLKTPLEFVEKFEDFIPTLNNVTIPIKVLKANYYFQNGEYDTALQLAQEGRKYNPYLFIPEYLISKIYYEKKEFLKAAKFAKESVEGLPNNVTHITNYQKILAELEDIDELQKVFDKSKAQKDEAIWHNHIFLLASLKTEFNEKDSIFAKEAFQLFPSNKAIATAEKLITLKKDKIVLANEYDQIAIQFYNDEKFIEAIEQWQNAKKIIRNDEAYFLNIAKCYTKIKNFEKSLNELNEIETLNISSNSGQLEFLKAMNYFQQNKNVQGCKFLSLSAQKGYPLSIDNLEKLCK
ncbi:hypothetical protein N9F74_02025 [Flavobacteriaceae bacterium]|nr:hypothetical protein [Flavobacteriaceae bacterium]